jgi:hypothetical protein
LGAIGPQFCRHATFLAHAPAHLDDLLWPQLGKTESANCFHVNKYVCGAFTTREEAEAADAVEPLHHRPFPVALGLHDHMRALR